MSHSTNSGIRYNVTMYTERTEFAPYVTRNMNVHNVYNVHNRRNILTTSLFHYVLKIFVFVAFIYHFTILLLLYLIPFIEYLRYRDNAVQYIHNDNELSYLLTKKEFQSLSHRKTKSSDNNNRCCICLCDYIRNQRLRVLPCQHFFHTRCIERWLTRINSDCPLCRSDVIEHILSKKK